MEREPNAPLSDAAMDNDLMDRYMAGDDEAGSILFTRHYQFLADFTGSYLRKLTDTTCRHTVDDVIQRVRTRVHHGRRNYNRRHPVRAWLTQHAKWAVKDWVREHCLETKGHRLLSIHGGEVGADQLCYNENNASKNWMEEKRQELREAVSLLLPVFRDVIQLHYYEGKSYQEVASALGITVGTVASRLGRARRVLTELMADLSAA